MPVNPRVHTSVEGVTIQTFAGDYPIEDQPDWQVVHTSAQSLLGSIRAHISHARQWAAANDRDYSQLAVVLYPAVRLPNGQVVIDEDEAHAAVVRCTPGL